MVLVLVKVLCQSLNPLMMVYLFVAERRTIMTYLLYIASLFAAIGVAMPALADDFVIDTPVTTTNGGHPIDGNASLTITETGSISTTNEAGVRATGENNTVNNHGSIDTEGEDAWGIIAVGNSTVDNYSTIGTTGNKASGITFEGQNNTVNNYGSISTEGDDARGIDAFAHTMVDNYGSINTTGNDASGIYAEIGNRVKNYGSISTTGNKASGIYSFDGTVDNYGSISTTGDAAWGIVFDGENNSVKNYGSIDTEGKKALGIGAQDNNTVYNFGSVSTTGDDAGGIAANNNNRVYNFGSISTEGKSSSGNINGAWGIYAETNNMVYNYCSISTEGELAYGINARDNNTVYNYGSIRTTGNDATGIVFDGENTVYNYCSISTTGDNAGGIDANYSNTVYNYGSISTTGNDAIGIFVNGENNAVHNYGFISTTGDNAAAIKAGFNNTVYNYGLIDTKGHLAWGIFARENNTVYNYGSISIEGDNVAGIFAETNTVLYNHGSINTTGDNATGIFAGNTNTVDNYGSVVSEQSDSFHFKGSGNTLNLNAPSFIGGRIDLGTNTALSISSGPSHSILWDLSTGTMEGGGPTLLGDVPIFYNAGTQQAATFDPTAIAAGSDMLADISGNVSLLILSRLESCRGCDDGWWMSGFGSTANYEGKAAALDYDFSHGGFALGYDRSVSSDLSLGILAGHGWSWFDANSRFAESWDNTSNGWFAALYGRKTLGNVFITMALSGGMLNHSDNRFVNDNLAPLGVSSAKASYDSWWLSPEAAIGIELGGSPVNGWTWTPAVRIRYATQWIEGYTETGPSAANAVLDSRNVDMLEGRLELAATKQLGDIARLTGRIGWLNRTSPGDESVSIIMIGETTTVPFSSDDHNIGYLGAEMHFDLSKAVSLDVIGEAAVIGPDMSLLRGAAVLSACF